jgi:hypothetical protein
MRSVHVPATKTFPVPPLTFTAVPLMEPFPLGVALLSGVQVDDGGHPRFLAFPSLGGRVTEEPQGPVAMFINTEHPRG